MKKYPILPIINIVALLVTLVVNTLSVVLPLNGQTPAEISDRFDIYFVPAGYVFSIWSLIYVLLIGFAIYQALPSQRENLLVKRIGYLFLLTCIANSAWIFLWHYEYFALSIVAMGTLLLSLIGIYLRLDIGRVTVSKVDRWLIHLTFSIYLGWITVATIANVSSYLDSISWQRWGLTEETWFVIMIGVALGIALAMMVTRRDVAYLLVLVWAFAGIAAKFPDVSIVTPTTWVATVGVALMALGSFILQQRRPLVPA